MSEGAGNELREQLARALWAANENDAEVWYAQADAVLAVLRASQRRRSRERVLRALGLAQSLAELPEDHRTEEVREIGRELVESLSEAKERQP